MSKIEETRYNCIDRKKKNIFINRETDQLKDLKNDKQRNKFNYILKS